MEHLLYVASLVYHLEYKSWNFINGRVVVSVQNVSLQRFRKGSRDRFVSKWGTHSTQEIQSDIPWCFSCT